MFKVTYLDIATDKEYVGYYDSCIALEHIIHAINVTPNLILIDIEKKRRLRPNV